jgi:hypothetical protein
MKTNKEKTGNVKLLTSVTGLFVPSLLTNPILCRPSRKQLKTFNIQHPLYDDSTIFHTSRDGEDKKGKR